MDLTVSAKSARVGPNTGRIVEVDLEGVEPFHILDQFEVGTIIQEIGYEKLLNAMDIEDVKKHLDLIEAE